MGAGECGGVRSVGCVLAASTRLISEPRRAEDVGVENVGESR